MSTTAIEWLRRQRHGGGDEGSVITEDVLADAILELADERAEDAAPGATSTETEVIEHGPDPRCRTCYGTGRCSVRHYSDGGAACWNEEIACPDCGTPPVPGPTAEVKARLDADGTATGKTRIVAHTREGGCFGPGMPLVDLQYEAEDGTRTPLAAKPGPGDWADKMARDYKIGEPETAVTLAALLRIVDSDAVERCATLIDGAKWLSNAASRETAAAIRSKAGR